jgi:glycosyltransferase involved in cell wall biosynthesis
MPTAETGAPVGDLAVLIPAYRPEAALVSIATELAGFGFLSIIIIDDGSGPAYEPVFTALSKIEAVRILRHPHNLGKGAALKTGIAHALDVLPGLIGVVTADADGQHRPEDIRAVASVLRRCPESLILGSRLFEGDVPLRSRFGNALTRSVVRFLVGEKLRDTQTGLRAIPARFAASLLNLTSTGYEFELDMLISARTNSIAVIEQPIQTIYTPGNESSHFNPFVDSMKIYFVLGRFCAVSLMTALIDNVVFYIVYRYGSGLLAAQIAGRGAALAFNYVMVRDKVFRSLGRHPNALARYLVLVLASGAMSYVCVRLTIASTHVPVLLAKVGVETLLFFANFIVERDWVFSTPRRRGS